MNSRQFAALVLAFAVAPTVVQGAIVFDNSSVASSGGTTSGAGESAVAMVTVSAPTAINQIGALIDLNGKTSGGDGSLKFLIFDNATGTLLFNSGAQVFADDGLTFKLSNPFAPFTLLPGVTYDIGAISSVSATYAYGTPASDFTQDGITTLLTNGNALNYNNPTLNEATGVVMVALELGQVPEPETVALLGLGLAAAAFARRKHGSNAT